VIFSYTNNLLPVPVPIENLEATARPRHRQLEAFNVRCTIVHLNRRAERVCGVDKVSRSEGNLPGSDGSGPLYRGRAECAAGRPDQTPNPNRHAVSMQVMHPKVTLDRERDV
jgi:hypothetical protein